MGSRNLSRFFSVGIDYLVECKMSTECYNSLTAFDLFRPPNIETGFYKIVFSLIFSDVTTIYSLF